MVDFNIKKVLPTDVDVLMQIARRTFSDTYATLNSKENMNVYLDSRFSREQLSSELMNLDTEYYFAFIDERVIGYLKLNTGPSQTELKNENSLEIERIYVLKGYQGNKIGQKFCELAVLVARRKNIDFVWLGVWEKNLKAIRFYQKMGFFIFDKHIFRLGDENQVDIMMKCNLE